MATVPSITTQTTGGLAGAAWANSVKDGVDFLVGTGGNVRPLAVVRQTVSQTIPTATWTALTFGAEDLDTDGGHSTASNTSRYTAQTAGWFLVMGNVVLNSGSTGRRMLGVRKNGTGGDPQTHGRSDVHGVTLDVGLSHSAAVYLSVGDYVEVILFQDSGADLTTSVASGVQPTMTVLWETA